MLLTVPEIPINLLLKYI